MNLHPNEWADAERIANLPAVHEVIQGFAEDPTGDNGTMVVREVLRALAAATAPTELRALFDRKLADLEQRGHTVIGRILHKDGTYALFDGSCRWLTQPQYWRLMHEQDGSLFATAPIVAQPVVAVDEQKKWARETIEALAALDQSKKLGSGVHGQVIGCEPWVIRSNGYGIQCLHDAQYLIDALLDPYNRRAAAPATPADREA